MLKGEAKKDYQRAYMKEYMRKRRKVLTTGLNKTDEVLTPAVTSRKTRKVLVCGAYVEVPDD